MSHSLFNRKHYVVIAKLIANNNDDFEKLVDNLIIYFKNDNPKFSKDIFVNAIEEHMINNDIDKDWNSQ
tara:strand:- start:374 stop:580 length:207 start_codon:yes stop_codon:yes gene_type:complete